MNARKTMTTNGDICGPLEVRDGQAMDYEVDYTSGDITLHRSIDGSNYIVVEEAYTADTTKQAIAPGHYKLVGTSTPSAVCYMVVR
jgi:hypothetical protein